MLQCAALSERDRADYDEAGYLVIRQAFSPQDMDRIDRWSDELLRLPEAPGRHWVYWEKDLRDPDHRIVSRIENISPFHPGLAQVSRALAGLCAQLFGEPAVLFKEKINYKMPGGDGFKPHQDSQAGWEKYAKNFATVMLSVDDATETNGCLMLVAGHHRRGLFRAWEPLCDDDMAGMDFTPCPTRRGDVVVIDSYAPHSSEPNLTDQQRRIYFATYNRQSEGDHLAAYYADKRQTYPPDIERERDKEYVFKV
jgi:hypothetical protein